MTAFQLDTSGEVFWPSPEGHSLDWSDIAKLPHGLLAQGYIEAGFASMDRDFMGEPRFRAPWLDVPGVTAWLNVGFRDLAPATLAAMLKDCEARLSQASPPYPNTREEGARTWEKRQAGKLKLHGFPPVTLSIGDDGLIYQEVVS